MHIARRISQVLALPMEQRVLPSLANSGGVRHCHPSPPSTEMAAAPMDDNSEIEYEEYYDEDGELVTASDDETPPTFRLKGESSKQVMLPMGLERALKEHCVPRIREAQKKAKKLRHQAETPQPLSVTKHALPHWPSRNACRARRI